MTKNDPNSLIQIARENGNSEGGLPLDLGLRVRELRKARNWTLEQAASQAGLARSTLSKIENGQMSPTYDALKKLAIGLEISVPQLFTPPVNNQINGRLAHTKAGGGKAMSPPPMSMSSWPIHCRKSSCCPIALWYMPGLWRSSTAGSAMMGRNFSMC